jgi:hypothetical protein
MIFILLLTATIELLPVVCFVVAAIAEIRIREKGPAVFFYLRMAGLVTGTIAFWANFNAGQSATLSWNMVFFSLFLGCLVLVSKYASKVGRFFAVFGNGVLAFLWHFKGAYHP